MGELSGLKAALEREREKLAAQSECIARVELFLEDMRDMGFRVDMVDDCGPDGTVSDLRVVVVELLPIPHLGVEPALAIEDLREEEPAAAAPVVFEDHPAAETELAQECPPAAIDRKDQDPGETHHGVGVNSPADAGSTSGAGDVVEHEDPAPRADAHQAAVQDDGPADRQQVDRAAPVTGRPWTDEEVAILVERTASAIANASGTVAGIKEAADMIGRPFESTKTKAYSKSVRPSIDARVKEIFAHRLAAKAAKGAVEAPAYMPGPRQAVAERPSESAAIVPQWQRELRALLNAVGYPAPFTPAIDLEIIERQSRGEKAHEIALDLGIDVVLLRQRVIALLPDTGMQAQARLLGELRLRAGVEAA